MQFIGVTGTREVLHALVSVARRISQGAAGCQTGLDTRRCIFIRQTVGPVCTAQAFCTAPIGIGFIARLGYQGIVVCGSDHVFNAVVDTNGKIRQTGGAVTEISPVTTVSATQHVRAATAHQGVIACATDQGVICQSALEDIVASAFATHQGQWPVVGAAVQGVIARCSDNDFDAGKLARRQLKVNAVLRVGLCGQVDAVCAYPPNNRVVDQVETLEHIVSAAALQGPDGGVSTHHRVVLTRTFQHFKTAVGVILCITTAVGRVLKIDQQTCSGCGALIVGIADHVSYAVHIIIAV